MIPIETAEADTFEMRYFRFGEGGKPMVIIPGLSLKSVMDSADAVAAAYSAFKQDFTVYVFDRRSKLPERYTVRDMAEDTAGAMRTLGIQGAYIFGTSQGGMIAQLIAAHYPELAAKLVLGSTAARLSEQSRAGIADWTRLAESGDTNALVQTFSKAVYSPAFCEKFRSAFDALSKMVTADEMKRFTVLASGLEDFDITADIADIRCPVLVIGAGEDHVLGAEASRDIAEITGGELYIYPEGSHAAYDEEPDYKDRILGFFAKD